MAHLSGIDFFAIGVLVVWVIGPTVRHYLHSRLFKAASMVAGVPSAMCSKCHMASSRFQHPPEGGTLCHKCSNWS